MEIRVISVRDNHQQMEYLFEQHWEETASNKKSRTLNINKNLFFKLEEENSLLSLGIFEEDKLVGYSINFLSPDTHDCSKLLCINDALYIQPKYRKGSIGIRLIHKTEEEARNLQCYGVIWHAKPNTTLDTLLEKLNYGIKDFLYLKEL